MTVYIVEKHSPQVCADCLCLKTVFPSSLQFFQLEVYNSDGSRMTESQIHGQLLRIRSQSWKTDKEPMGILTSEHRHTWGEAYNRLLRGSSQTSTWFCTILVVVCILSCWVRETCCCLFTCVFLGHHKLDWLQMLICCRCSSSVEVGNVVFLQRATSRHFKQSMSRMENLILFFLFFLGQIV